MAFTSLSAVAATTTTLNLKGSIASLLEIAIAAETLATNLPMDSAVSAQKVGTVTERSNSGSGYQVSASSQNSGKLVRTGDNLNFVNYQLSYNNANITLSSTPTVISTNSLRGVFSRDLKITYSKPVDFMPAGEYSDTVTLTIAAN